MLLLFHPSSLIPPPLFGFLVAFVATAETAELAELQPFRRRLLVLRRNVVTMLAFRALQHNIIARHNSPSSQTASVESGL
jgi:hypothetical protein